MFIQLSQTSTTNRAYSTNSNATKESVVQFEDIETLIDMHCTMRREKHLWEDMYELETRLCAELKDLDFSHSDLIVYNPLEYAFGLHFTYLQKFLTNPKEVVFVTANPNPFGMCQTGIPLGEPSIVRDWMKIDGTVCKPPCQAPNFPVYGMKSRRKDGNAKHFWGLFQELCGDRGVDAFFERCFVITFCPLAFFTKSGRHVILSKLDAPMRKELQDICCAYLAEAFTLLQPKIIVSIGHYAECQVKELQKTKINRLDASVVLKGFSLPSPQSVNRKAQTKEWLSNNNIFK